MSVAYIGLGSNLGNRKENCEKAVSLMDGKGLTLLQQSSMIETPPWGVKDQPAFINMAVSVETTMLPEPLLVLLKEIENKMGRAKTCRWGPRMIDLDILFYDDLIINTSNLSIPHPLIQERDFVLRPLSEIAPDLVHPVLKKTVKELLDSL